jgi:putative acetyltransferase
VAEAAGERLVTLLGGPAYYRRFGFVRSTELGVGPPDPSGRALPGTTARRCGGAGQLQDADPFSRL